MQKFWRLLLVPVFALALAACGGEEDLEDDVDFEPGTGGTEVNETEDDASDDGDDEGEND